MKLKGLLFDFNGTLFFDSVFHLEAFRRMFRVYGKPIPSDDDMIHHIFGRTNATICLENFNSEATEGELVEFAAKKESEYRKLCMEKPNDCHLTEGAAELLDYAKQNRIPYCMATGSEMDNLEFYFTHLGLERWFTLDNIVYTDGTFSGKPNPDIYQIAAEKIGLSPSECCVFEDGTSGILAANRAGVGAVAAVYEEGLPSPVNDSVRVQHVLHNFLSWKELLSEYGLLR